MKSKKLAVLIFSVLIFCFLIFLLTRKKENINLMVERDTQIKVDIGKVDLLNSTQDTIEIKFPSTLKEGYNRLVLVYKKRLEEQPNYKGLRYSISTARYYKDEKPLGEIRPDIDTDGFLVKFQLPYIVQINIDNRLYQLEVTNFGENIMGYVFKLINDNNDY